jgi:hypothetical protein
LLATAADTRRALHHQEPNRIDLAEELEVTLVLLTGVVTQGMATEIKEEALGVLEPFERAATITPKGMAVLRWVRGGHE